LMYWICLENTQINTWGWRVVCWFEGIVGESCNEISILQVLHWDYFFLLWIPIANMLCPSMSHAASCIG
jgi:hypothetical protein